MSALVLQVTAAGRAALVNAPNTGTQTVLVAQLGVTEQAFAAATDGSDLALPGELKRLSTIAGEVVAADTIHVSVTDATADVYDLRGFGLYLDDGTLFALYGQADPIMGKSDQSMLVMAIDAIFQTLDVSAITFGNADFALPLATTERSGIVELATNAEAIAGADSQRALTPATNKAAMDDRLGPAAPSPFFKALLGLATAAALRLAIEIKSAALKDMGPGNGLDADTVDGQHAAAFAAAVHTHSIDQVGGLQAALDGKQPAGNYAAAVHTHSIDQVGGLQAALDGRAVLIGNNTYAGQQYLETPNDTNYYNVLKVGPQDDNKCLFLAVQNGAIKWIHNGWYGTGTIQWIMPNGSMGLDYNGNLALTGAVTATGGFQVSDRRSKHAIELRPVDTTIAAQLAPLWSQWNRNSDDGFDTGLIAQDVQRIAPQFVKVPDDPDAMLAIDKAGIAMECALGAAIRINQLLARIEELEKTR